VWLNFEYLSTLWGVDREPRKELNTENLQKIEACKSLHYQDFAERTGFEEYADRPMLSRRHCCGRNSPRTLFHLTESEGRRLKVVRKWILI
jgi:hypothetical protein